jgi:polyhydroxybutyrate depolymerase
MGVSYDMSIATGRLCCALLLMLAGCRSVSTKPLPETNDWSPGLSTHQLDVGGMTRSFRLHVPPRARRNVIRISQAFPLLIVLHGSGDNGESAQRFSRMDSVADARGWVVAYPDASGAGGIFGLHGADWNAGECCGGPQHDGVDDVGFIMRVIDRVEAELPVEHRQVFVAGFSDGARLAYTVACRHAVTITAIAVVAGSLEDPACKPAAAVPLIAFHGSADDQVDYLQPTRAAARLPLLAMKDTVPPSVQVWAANNGCRQAVSRKVTRHVRRVGFTGCNRGPVLFYAIAGGAHGWPSSPDGPGAAQPLNEVNATALIADFLSRQRR